MNTADPLAQLRDIHLPEPVGLWPLAWGWWVLMLLLLATLGAALYRYNQIRQQKRYRLQAADELHAIKRDYEQQRDPAAYLQQLNMLLRRCLLHVLPREDIAGLHGEPWLQQLDAACPACEHGFSQGAGRALLLGPYQPNPQIDAESLYQLVLTWLQKHRVPSPKERSPVTSEVQGHA